MTIYNESSYEGMRVYAANEKSVMVYTDYTLYYHSMEKKIFSIGNDKTERGFAQLSKILLQVVEKSGRLVNGCENGKK